MARAISLLEINPVRLAFSAQPRNRGFWGLLGLACLVTSLGSPPVLRGAEDVPEELPAATAEAAAARRIMQEAISQSEENGAATAGRATATSDAAAPVPDDLLVARISAEVAAKQLEARRTAQRSPAEALALLDEAAA